MDAPPSKNNHHNLVTSSSQVVNGYMAFSGRLLVQKSQKCALCHERIPDNLEPCSFPSTAPAALAALKPHLGSDEAYHSTSPKVFCHTCWVWIYNLSICWTCGETVAREEEKNPIPPPPWTNDPRGISLHTLPLCRYCVDDLAFLKIEIVHDNLPAAMPLPKPPLLPLLPSQPGSSESSCRRPTPKWMEKLPSNRVSKQSAPRIPEPLIPLIIEPSAPPPPCIQNQPPPPRRDPKKSTSTPILPPSSSSPSTTTTILLPPDPYTTTTTPSSSTNATVVVGELRTPIRSSSIRKTYASAAALTRTRARKRRRFKSQS